MIRALALATGAILLPIWAALKDNPADLPSRDLLDISLEPIPDLVLEGKYNYSTWLFNTSKDVWYSARGF